MTWTKDLARRPGASLLRASQCKPVTEASPHALIIGSGFGGLAAAVRLGVRGYRVTVLERLDQAGGRARVFKQDGFTFDAGPTVITAPFLFEELWQLCGRELSGDVELRPISPFYRIRFHDATFFDYTGDPVLMKEEIAKISPADVEGYEYFFEKSKEIFEVGFEELGHVPFSNITDMLKIIPAMVKLESYRTVYGLVSKYIEHPKIRKVLSFHPLLVGGNPFNVTSIYTLIAYLERKWGVYYAMGGTGALVSGLQGLIEDEIGGSIRFDAEVNEILTNGSKANGVSLTSGEMIEGDLVVSNADVAWTYRHLLPEDQRERWTNKRLQKMKYSMGLFVWYFGTRRRYPDVEHHTILLGERYKALLDDIFHRKYLARDFSLYLHRPTKTDPSMAPSGQDAFYVLSPVPNLDSGTDWKEMGEAYRHAISRYLGSTILPGLEEEIVTSRIFTPLDFKNDYLAYKGAAFSVEPVLTQSAYFRPHNKSEEIEDLYFVGAGTHPGAGLPGVLSSARVLDTVIPDPRFA